MQKWRSYVCLGMTLVFLAGCAPMAAQPSVSSQEPTKTVVDSPMPTEISTPEPVDYDAWEAATRSAYEQALLDGLTGLELPAAEGAGELAEQCETWQEICLALQKALDQGMQAVKENLELLGDPTPALKTEISLPGWKYLAALSVGMQEEFLDILAEGCRLELTANEQQVTAQVKFEELGSLLPERGEKGFMTTLLFAYLNTVYDEAGKEIPYEEYRFQEGYLETVAEPLPGKHIKDGWYNDRDQGKRKHTGTDIKAPEDTPILSCTAGTVIYIGSNEGAGNYVVVEDDYGFQYHYYHMVRLTDFLQVGDRVEQGEVVGNVGNTGNSDANHLHLTIVSPQFTYINPYPVLKEIRERES